MNEILKGPPNEQFLANIQREIAALLGGYRKPKMEPRVQAALYGYLRDTVGVETAVLDRICPLDGAAAADGAKVPAA